ncbi:vancomycin high temperature exclusion protein [Photobacterium rosenbergii]|uniref:ElyC/SanA/YdcF family protein n=1 Tax=Photobacterium rosenbergii TaxID=294936 RepID=A0ABU3ZFZ9_9GAMM|nr:ElyC/SanA/YdcF family protein [Photobacterium rosenbergii]MDV5168953.1 ElyC/SanA/YdcF family protein [Photobacterium rosenbergii]
MKIVNIIRLSAIGCILLISCILLIDRWFSDQAASRIFDNTESTPARSVGLVLGTSKYIAKSLNPYYQYRMDAAQQLYQEGKVNILLLSGDNAHRSYNEPWTMKRDLLKSGIPEQDIVLDYAGFRTLDSIVRAKSVFDANHFVIITQRFHCERALFIADRNRIDAICLAVPEPIGLAGLKIRTREVLARIKALIDVYILDMKPKFAGPKEPIERGPIELEGPNLPT